MIEGEPESTLIPFVDKAANDTKNIVAEDISKLQAVGVSDADIVRLCELIAFVAYQVRVAAGLRLMNGAVRLKCCTNLREKYQNGGHELNLSSWMMLPLPN